MPAETAPPNTPGRRSAAAKAAADVARAAEAGVASQTAADRAQQAIAPADVALEQAAASNRIPVTILDPDDVGDLTELLGTDDTLRVSLILRCGDHLHGRIIELVADADERVRWIGFQRENDLTPEKGLLVERIRLDAIDYIGRREALDLDLDPDGVTPTGMVRIPPQNFTSALVGRRAAPLLMGQVRRVGTVVAIQRAVDQAGGDMGYWAVHVRHDGADAYTEYVIPTDATSGLLVAEE